MSRRKSGRSKGSKSIDPRAFPDTTPIYPRPLGSRVQPVIDDLLIDLENIAPGYYPLATLLVRQLRGRQYTDAESMWAIHEACHLGALRPIDRRFYCRPIDTVIGEEWDIKIVDGRVEVGELLVGPSGIPLRPGRLHVDNKQNDLWGILVFEINHERVAELRFQRETATVNTGGQSPADLGGTQTIRTYNAHNALVALLAVFTEGVADERINKAAAVLSDSSLTVDQKLTKIDALIPIPFTASAEKLGKMLGVTKQAVANGDWWEQNRKGEKQNEIGRRRTGLQEKSKRWQRDLADDDEEVGVNS